MHIIIQIMTDVNLRDLNKCLQTTDHQAIIENEEVQCIDSFIKHHASMYQLAANCPDALLRQDYVKLTQVLLENRVKIE